MVVMTLLRVDDTDAATRLGRDVDPTPVRTHRRAFRFEPDRHTRDHTIRFDVCDQRRACVFVGDVQTRGIVVDDEILRIGVI